MALEMIGNLYAVEAEIREQGLKGAKKQDVRLTKAKPLVEAFFTWMADTGLLPSNPLSKALAYAHKRRAGLEVFLSDADVPIRHKSSGKRLTGDPHGPAGLAVLLDGTGCQAGRHRAELSRLGRLRTCR